MPRLHDHPSSQEAPFSLGALIGFRLVIVTVLLFVAGYIEAVQEGTLRVPIFLLISATFALNLGYAILLAVAPYRTQALVQIMGDLLVITGFVYLTGTGRTGFSILYPISVLCGSVLLGRGFLVAAVANGLFASVLLLVRAGMIPDEAVGQIARGPLRGVLGAIVGMALSSFPVAALGQFLTKALKRAGESLDAAAGEVATLQDFNRLVVENIHSGLLVTDSSDRVSFANASVAEMLGHPRGTLEGRLISELFDSQELRNPSHPEAETTLEIDHPRGDGEVRILGLWISELSGNVVGGRLIVIRDLTDVRKLEAQALLNEKLAVAGSTAAQLAHEIRNPLGAISAATKLLSEGSSVAEDQKSLLRIISKEADRLAATVTSYLRDVKTQKSVVFCDLNAVLSDAVRLIEISPERGPNHHINFTPHPETLRVAIAEDELMQVLWNLARNGLEAMPNGGCLTFALRRVEGFAEVEVADEGHGMDRRQLAQLFEPLRTSKAMGTGLGLAIAHLVMHAAGPGIGCLAIGQQGQSEATLVADPCELRWARRHDHGETTAAVLDLRRDPVERREAEAAVRAPGAADEAEGERTAIQELGAGPHQAVGIRQRKIGQRVADREAPLDDLEHAQPLQRQPECRPLMVVQPATKMGAELGQLPGQTAADRGNPSDQRLEGQRVEQDGRQLEPRRRLAHDQAKAAVVVGRRCSRSLLIAAICSSPEVINRAPRWKVT